MNPRFLAIAIFTLLLPVASAFAQTSTWIIDTKHTQIDFQIRRVPVSNVRGSFSRITGLWSGMKATLRIPAFKSQSRRVLYPLPTKLAIRISGHLSSSMWISIRP